LQDCHGRDSRSSAKYSKIMQKSFKHLIANQ
jgi:hypothetical protein